MRYVAEVTDAVGRKRFVVVEVRPGHVGVSAPAGGGFSMNADECDTLAYLLRAVADNARGHTGTDWGTQI